MMRIRKLAGPQPTLSGLVKWMRMMKALMKDVSWMLSGMPKTLPSLRRGLSDTSIILMAVAMLGTPGRKPMKPPKATFFGILLVTPFAPLPSTELG